MDQNINMSAQPQEKGPVGTTISVVVIVLILALGAYYFLKQVPVADEMNNGAIDPAEMQITNEISALSSQGTSTDIADIQKDLDATNLSDLEAGLSDINI